MKYVTFSELRLRLGGRARSTIYRDLEFKRLPMPVKIGHRLYWDEAEVQAAIETHRVSSHKAH